MSSKIRSRPQDESDIADYYAVNIKALWKGFKNEHICFWFLCVYFFFEYVRPQDLYPVIDILPWSQIFLLLSLAAVFTDRTVHWVSNLENKLLVLFCLIIILSSIFAFSPARSWDYRNVMGGWFLVYFLLINIVNSEKRLVLFLLFYFLFNLKMSQHGATTWISRGFSFSGWGLVGSPGWFHNSGEYAIQMLIFSFLATAFLVSFKDHWGRYKRFFIYAVVATGYMAVMGASSRGAQIALAVVGVWMLLKQKGGLRGLIAIAVMILALFFVLPEEQLQRFHEIGKDDSSLQRLAYWEYGLDVIKNHPLIGVGYHSWLTYVSYMVPEGMGPYQIVQEPHNIFIQAGAELGLLGLSVFLLMVIFAFVVNARTRTISKNLENRFLYYLTYGLDAGLIGYLVAGSFVTVLYYPFFWVQMGMIVAVHAIARHKSGMASSGARDMTV